MMTFIGGPICHLRFNHACPRMVYLQMIVCVQIVDGSIGPRISENCIKCERIERKEQFWSLRLFEWRNI